MYTPKCGLYTFNRDVSLQISRPVVTTSGTDIGGFLAAHTDLVGGPMRVLLVSTPTKSGSKFSMVHFVFFYLLRK